MSETSETRKKCSKCKVNHKLENFRKKRNDEYNKMCNKCLDLDYIVRNTRKKCEHGKRPTRCKDCNGGSICEHSRERSQCKDCNGGSICVHNHRRSTCKECDDGGGGICEHGINRSCCRRCGGNGFCCHGKAKSRCRECDGSGFCEHGPQRDHCRICDFGSYIRRNVSCRIWYALKKEKTLHSHEYIGCDVPTLKTHLESQFRDGMNWDNYGSEWHIDHIIPLKYENPTLEKMIERLHFTNTQPLWAEENVSKGNRYIG